MADYFNAMQSIGSRSAFEKNIKILEKEKKQLAEIIGNNVYEYCVKNPGADVPFAEIQNIFNEMNLRDQHIKIQLKKIEDYDNEVRRAQGGVQCSCGHVNVVGVRFCEKCGTPVVPIFSGTRCSCGHVNAEGARFCAKCGASIALGGSTNESALCKCGYKNVPGAKFCAKCGNNLI